MFEFDITEAVRPEAGNLVAVRVVNPTNAAIDGLVIREAPGRNRFEPWGPGATYNSGGIQDSVEILITPLVRIEDLYVKPDAASRTIDAEIAVLNALEGRIKGHVTLSVAPAASGETLDLSGSACDLDPGRRVVRARVRVPDVRLWQLDDPVLYRVTARIVREGSDSIDEMSTRRGFRDFRFEDGCFRLNGKRIYLKSTHSASPRLPSSAVAVSRGKLPPSVTICCPSRESRNRKNSAAGPPSP